jgi:FkbM family methyltransferase
VAAHLPVEAFVDDFTMATEHLGRPVVRISDVPKDALVLNAAGGRLKTARRYLTAARLRNLDYFAFFKMSGLPLIEARFNEGFQLEFETNRDHYNFVYRRLADALSREVYRSLVWFRYTYNIAFLEGFEERQDQQYFEDLLELKHTGETFYDVGGFKGETTCAFARRFPGYRAVHLFEPEEDNFSACLAVTANLERVICHSVGLSRTKEILKFDASGSCSKVADNGETVVNVDKLDNIQVEAPTFIKMDIEGAEGAAIEGGARTIGKYRPKIAMAVYHRPGDFWRIPEQILGIREDYDLYLRHYTESIYETVMYFVPRSA